MLQDDIPATVHTRPLQLSRAHNFSLYNNNNNGLLIAFLAANDLEIGFGDLGLD